MEIREENIAIYEKSLEKKEEDIKKKLEKINKVKEVKESIASLERSQEKMKKEMEKELRKLDEQINKKVVKVVDIEELKKKEMLLEQKEQMLQESYERFEKEQEQLRRNEMHIIAEHAIRPSQQKEVLKEAMSEKRTEPLAIYTLIDQAAKAVENHNFNGAKEMYKKIQSLYSSLDMPPQERKKVYYEVMELKTDIELGLLEATSQN